MPPLPVIADVFRVAINWTAPGGQSAENVMHFLGAGGDSADLAAQLDSQVDANMFQTVASGVAATTCSITPLDGVTGTADFPLTNWEGASAGASWVPQVALLITQYTATRGRRSRGRTYLPFTAEGAIDDGKVIPGGTVTPQVGWSDFVADMQTAGIFGWQLCVASYGRPDRAHPAGWTPAAYPVTSVFVREVLATQRLRQSRVA